jgi:hypothetical protein
LAQILPQSFSTNISKPGLLKCHLNRNEEAILVGNARRMSLPDASFPNVLPAKWRDIVQRNVRLPIGLLTRCLFD